MKTISQIVGIIKANNSSEAKLLAFEVLALMLEREAGVEEIHIDTISNSGQEMVGITQQRAKEKKISEEPEPEDITEEVSDVLDDDGRMKLPPAFPKGELPEPPKYTPKNILDKVLKK